MKKMKWAAYCLTAVLTMPSMAYGEVYDVTMDETALCDLCGQEMDNGVCKNHEHLILEEPALVTDQITFQQYYEISNAGELLWFISEDNAGALSCSDVLLTEDIYLADILNQGYEGYEFWQPLGTAWKDGTSKDYGGIFDGGGHVIHGIELGDLESAYASVFGSVGQTGTVKNLGIEDMTGTLTQDRYAGLSIVNRGTIENCYVDQSEVFINYTSYPLACADLIVENYGVVENCFTALVFRYNIETDDVNLSYHPLIGYNRSDGISQGMVFNSYVEQDSRYSASPAEGVTIMASDTLSSGELAYRLNASQTEPAYTQMIWTDSFPRLITDQERKDYSYQDIYCITVTDSNGTTLYFRNGGVNFQISKPYIYTDPWGNTGELNWDIIVATDLTLVEKGLNVDAGCAHSTTWEQIIMAATCSHPGQKQIICSDCGVVLGTEDIPQTAHSFTIYQYANNANCLHNGTESAWCDYGCGTQDVREVPGTQTAHLFNNYTYDYNATCMADGTNSSYCAYGCGTTDTVAAEGTRTTHSFTNYVYMNDATCEQDGTYAAYCDYHCGTMDSVAAEGTKTGHLFTTYSYNNDATCQTDGTESAVCAYGCGATDTRSAYGTQLMHSFSSYTYNNDATCMTDGTETALCDQGCGQADTRTAYGTQTSHTFTNYQFQNDATCMTDGTKTAWCDYGCGTTDTVMAEGTKLAHSFTAYAFNNDANCAHDGTETAWCDYGCMTSDTRTAEGTQTEHRFVNYTYMNDASCMADGTKKAFCEYLCGTSDVQTAEGTRVGHDFVSYVYNNDANCQHDGTETSVCKYGCGTTDTRTALGTITGHIFSHYEYNGDADCSHDGTETAKCDFGCGQTDTRTAVNTITDHSFTSYSYNNDANCQKDGTKTAFCDYGCGTAMTVTEYNTRTAHQFTDYYYNNDATCTEDGTETSYCSYGCGETDTRSRAGTAAGHVYAGGICLICNAEDPSTVPESITASVASATEVYGKSIVLSAPEGYLLKLGTTTADPQVVSTEPFGSDTKAVVRLVNGSNDIEYYLRRSGGGAVAKRNLTVNADTVAPVTNLVENGEYCRYQVGTVSDANAVTCTVNGDPVKIPTAKLFFTEAGVKTIVFADAAGNETVVHVTVYTDHLFDDGEITLAASCTADGTEKLTCLRCGYSKLEKIDALGHIFTGYVFNNDASCTDDGTETALCDHGCGSADSRIKPQSALGHQYENGVCVICGDMDPSYIGPDVYASVVDPKPIYQGVIAFTAPEGYYIRAWNVTVGQTAPVDSAESNEESATLVLTDGDNELHYLLRKGESTHEVERVITVPSDSTAPVIEIYEESVCGSCILTIRDERLYEVLVNGTEYIPNDEGKLVISEIGSWTIIASDIAGNRTEKTVSVVNHDWEESVIHPATCQEEGLARHVCKRCGTNEEVVLPASGHAYENGVCQECGEKDPTWLSPDIYARPVNPKTTYNGTITLRAPFGYTIRAYNRTMGMTQPTTEESSRDRFVTLTLVDGENELCYKLRKLMGGPEYDRATTVVSDTAAPVIVGAENGRSYCETRTITIDDFGSVRIQTGETMDLLSPGRHERILTDHGLQMIYAKDEAGNNSTIFFTIVDHSWISRTSAPASCTEDGELTWICSNCFQTYETTIPMTGHSYFNGVCTVCGEADPEVGEKPLAAEIANPSAVYGSQITLKAPDGCLLFGWNATAGEKSSEEDIYYEMITIFLVDGENEIHYVLSKEGEESVERILLVTADTKAPEIAGVTDGETYCTRAVLTITDESTYIVTANDEDVIPLPDGTLEVAQSGEWTIVVTDASGLQASVHFMIEDHNFDEGVITKESTCLEEGEKTFTCIRCGQTMLETLPLIGHQYFNGICRVCGSPRD